MFPVYEALCGNVLSRSICNGLVFCHIIYSLAFWVTNSILWLSPGWERPGQSPADRSLESRGLLWLQLLGVWQDRSGACWGPRRRRPPAQFTSTLLCDHQPSLQKKEGELRNSERHAGWNSQHFITKALKCLSTVTRCLWGNYYSGVKAGHWCGPWVFIHYKQHKLWFVLFANK